MSNGQQLPEGKWLCPECRVVDPALLGPLRGGAKASLDWFSVDDIQESMRIAKERRNSIFSDRFDQFQPQALNHMSVGMEMDPSFPTQDGDNSMHLAPETLMTSAEWPSTETSATSLVLHGKATSNAAMIEGKNFLVVHGNILLNVGNTLSSAGNILSNGAGARDFWWLGAWDS